MSGILHIASLLVHHRPDAAARLDALLQTLPGADLALREGGRSIVLCEGEEESTVLDCIDALHALDGVIGVGLVHHHAERTERLMEEIDHDHPT